MFTDCNHRENFCIMSASTLNVNVGVLGHIDSGKTSLGGYVSSTTESLTTGRLRAQCTRLTKLDEGGIRRDLGIQIGWSTWIGKSSMCLGLRAALLEDFFMESYNS